MRMLRVTTIFAHPGYERAFMQAEWTLSAACEKVNSQVPWMVYEVISGLPGPTFVVLTPMSSIKELDDALAVDSAIQKVEGGTVWRGAAGARPRSLWDRGHASIQDRREDERSASLGIRGGRS